MLAKGIKRRASYSKSIRIVLRHPFLSVSERAITTWQFASGGNQYDVDMQHLLEHPLYTLEGFLLIQGGKGHSIETSRGITESNGYGLGRELHYVHSIAAFLYAHDANVDKDWTRNRVLQHWPPGIEDQYSDDVFERSELPPEVIDRMCRRIDKMLEWFVTRGSKVDERSNIAGKPAEIV
ncbi:hypothetical protein E8E11_005012 [Didymella keratinophila]|nr:hypothetical protein E8E11_005012 [Didymella keratinophila]